MSHNDPAVIAYASSPQKPRLNVSDFLFYFVAMAMLVALIQMTVHSVERSKKVYEDFKLELGSTAQIVIDAGDFLQETHGDIWLWALPLGVPFLLVRLRPETRSRVMLLAVLLAGLISVFAMMSIQQVWNDLMTGMTSKK
jgi:type II secretory pathway component PulF